MAQEDISPRASLAAIGQRFQQMGVWSVVEQSVHIKQKVLRHTPTDKLKDCLINILAGGNGLVETNTRVRPDRAIQGRVQEPLWLRPGQPDRQHHE